MIVAWKSRYRTRIYHKGIAEKTYIIGLRQNPIGHKQIQGDNRTPEGDYRIIQKSRGPFAGDYSQYLGVAWMRINYPNYADAIRGFEKKLITEAQKKSIISANNSGQEPPKNTKLAAALASMAGGANGPAATGRTSPGDAFPCRIRSSSISTSG